MIGLQVNPINMNYNKQIKNHYSGHRDYKLFGLDCTKRFHWDIITLCNYKCEYCYARAETYKWGKITNKNIIDEVLRKLSLVNGDIEMIILGGEPTLHPNYFYIFDRLFDMGDKVRVMGNITNGSFKNPEVVISKHLKYINNFHWNVTFHPSQIKDFDEFKRVVSIIKDYGFKININIMFDNPVYKEVTDDMLQFCIDGGFRFYFNVVFDHDSVTYIHYDEEYKDWLRETTLKYGLVKELEYYNDGVMVGKYDDIDVYLNGLSDFKGWKCRNNNYQISVSSSDIHRFCSWDSLTIDELNNIDDYMVCPLQQCTCQGKLTNEKIKY